jgi:hypothetical protein|tara:strand:- start:4206 stop:4583 length:378 start_codon:yes stop_codon:yes gene_type:complete
MSYSFDTILLSAQKTGTPQQVGTTLSAFGVNTVHITTNDVGIAFNALTPVGATTTMNVEGSIWTIDQVYDGSVMAIVKVADGAVKYHTIFTQNSAFAVVPVSAIDARQLNVDDPETRRKYLYGYI